MPVKMGKKKYKSHGTAVGALKRKKGKKGIKNPDAYVATVERAQKKGRKKKK
jgi:hypothetical protein